MFKTGLNIAHFKTHVSMIEEETIEYFKRWGDSGVKSKDTFQSWLLVSPYILFLGGGGSLTFSPGDHC